MLFSFSTRKFAWLVLLIVYNMQVFVKKRLLFIRIIMYFA